MIEKCPDNFTLCTNLCIEIKYFVVHTWYANMGGKGCWNSVSHLRALQWQLQRWKLLCGKGKLSGYLYGFLTRGLLVRKLMDCPTCLFFFGSLGALCPEGVNYELTDADIWELMHAQLVWYEGTPKLMLLLRPMTRRLTLYLPRSTKKIVEVDSIIAPSDWSWATDGTAVIAKYVTHWFHTNIYGPLLERSDKIYTWMYFNTRRTSSRYCTINNLLWGVLQSLAREHTPSPHKSIHTYGRGRACRPALLSSSSGLKVGPIVPDSRCFRARCHTSRSLPTKASRLPDFASVSAVKKDTGG